MSGVALPPALRAAIAAFAQEYPIGNRAAALSENYRANGGSERIADAHDIAAYLVARMPATYAATLWAMRAAAERTPAFRPRTLIDLGAGPGTASWAALAVWHGIERITMVDAHPQLLSAARALSREAVHPALRNAEFVAGDFARLDSSARYDCAVASYALAELPQSRAGAIAENLWAPCEGLLLVVEPGTEAGFARIHGARDALIASGARIAAPCVGEYACPIAGSDWCHFAVRLPRSRDHMRAKQAEVPFEDEKFSYVAVVRDGIAIARAAARVLSRPHRMKPGTRLKLCTQKGIEDRVVAVRDRAAFKATTKKEWGDAL